MKSIYEVPELNVTLFYTSDVMTASGLGENDLSYGDTDWGTTSTTVDGNFGQ